MLRAKKILLIIMTMAVLFGCQTSLQRLRNAEPVISEFHIYLAREYLDFSEAEAENYDWKDSFRFSRKGLKVSQGINSGPEDLSFWSITSDVKPVLEQARSSLLKVLTPRAVIDYPKESARAQFLFDCWVEQQEENWQDSHIIYCREEFYSVMDKLSGIVAQNIEEERAAVAMQAARDVEFARQEVSTHIKSRRSKGPATKLKTDIVYFKFDSYLLSDAGKRQIVDVAVRLQKVSDYNIMLNSYSDKPGGEKYNIMLSKKRAIVVKKNLIKEGVDREKIMIFAFGENDQRVATKGDGKERENRVTEIVAEFY